MKTDDLIKALAAEAPPRMHAEIRLAAAGFAGLMTVAAAFIMIFGVRPDLATAAPSTALKIGFAMLALIGLAPLALRAARPSVRLRDTLVPIAGLALIAATVTIVGLIAAPEGMRLLVWTGGGVPDCLRRIPIIALPIGALLFMAARALGPTRLGAAGAALGGVAGALAAIPYSLFCPIDSAPYVATWYLAAIGLCAGAGAVAGARWLRW
jgi:hypothetical protein